MPMRLWRSLITAMPRGATTVAAVLVALCVGAAPRTLVAQRRSTSPVPAEDTIRRAKRPAKPAAATGKPASPSPSAGGKSASTRSGAMGTVVDSIHGEPLVGARVSVDGTSVGATTDAQGNYRIDSIPPGQHRLGVAHPLLDTLGLDLATRPIDFPAGQVAVVELATPSTATILDVYCPAARRALGPAALVGRVLDADTDAPVPGVKVSLVWSEVAAGVDIGVRRLQRVREGVAGNDGTFQICGLPSTLRGTVQAIRGNATTGEVQVAMDGGLLALATLRIGTKDTVSTVATTDSAAGGARTMRVRRGAAAVSGRVTNMAGAPIAGARVYVPGTAAATQTSETGDFTLTGLPSGTQTVMVRRIGYAPSEATVELTSRRPQRVTLALGEAVATLKTVRVEAKRNKGLETVGFTNRRKSSMGYFITREDIDKGNPLRLSDIFRTTPGLRVSSVNGQATLESSRDPRGCVLYVVDGSPWQSLYPGDIDSALPPEEIAAAEVYSGGTTPAEFQSAGNTSCTTVVIWTRTRTGERTER